MWVVVILCVASSSRTSSSGMLVGSPFNTRRSCFASGNG